MADQKISELTQLVAANIAATDELAIVDSSVPRTKKVTASDLADYVVEQGLFGPDILSTVGDGTTGTYALGWTPTSESTISVFVDGVLQDYVTDAAYAVAGSNIVLAENLPDGSLLTVFRREVASTQPAFATNVKFVQEYKTVAALQGSNEAYAVLPVGEYVRVLDGNFVYKILNSASTGDVANGAATPVQFEVLPRDGSYPYEAFNSTPNTFAEDKKAYSGRHLDTSSEDLFLLAGEATTRSGITLGDLSTKDSTGNGVIVGSRASTAGNYTEQQDRVGMKVSDVHVLNSGDVSGSTYGIAVVAKDASITNFHVEGVTPPTSTGDDNEGLYTKLQDSFVGGGFIKDCGREASLSVKGKESGDTTGPAGFGNLFQGIKFECSAAFAASDLTAASTKKGVKIECGGNTFRTLRFDGFTGAAWYTGTGAVSSFSISDVEVFGSGAAGAGAARVLCESGTYRIRDHQINNAGGSAIEVAGQNSATTVVIEEAVIRSPTQSAFLLSPSTTDVLDVEVKRCRVGNTGNHLFALTDQPLKSLWVEDCVIEGIGGSYFNTSAVPKAITWKNTSIKAQTTDATNTTVFTIPVPTDGSGSMTVEVTGVSGNESYYRSYEALYTNTSGTATKEGENAGTAITSAGAAAWTSVVNATGGSARIRVTGAAATTVDWVVKINFDASS